MLGLQNTYSNYLSYINSPDTNLEYCNNYGLYSVCSYRYTMQVNVPIPSGESAQSYSSKLSYSFFNSLYFHSVESSNIFDSIRMANGAFPSVYVSFNPYLTMNGMTNSFLRPSYAISEVSASWTVTDQMLGTIFPSISGHVLSVEAIPDVQMILVFLSSCHYVLLDANGNPVVYENSNDYNPQQLQRTCSQAPLIIPDTDCSCYWYCECKNIYNLLYVTETGSITTITSFTSSSPYSNSNTILRAAGVQLTRLSGTNNVIGISEKGLIREIINYRNRQSISLQALQVESIQFTSTESTDLSQAYATLRNGSVAYLKLTWYDGSHPSVITLNKTAPNLWTATVSFYFLRRLFILLFGCVFEYLFILLLNLFPYIIFIDWFIY